MSHLQMLKIFVALFLAVLVGVCRADVTVACWTPSRTTFSPAQPWPFDTIAVQGEWVPFCGNFTCLPPPALLGATAQVQGNVITLDMYASDTALPPGIQPYPQANPQVPIVQVIVGPLAAGNYTLTTAMHVVDAMGAISEPCGPAAVSTTLTIEQAVGPVGTLAAIEYYDAALDHYFITASTVEIAALDNGMFPGWNRTGLSFKVFTPGPSGGIGVPVCRFYGLPSAGLDSHFYTANQSECAAIPDLYHGAWQLEGSDVFEIRLPDLATGACAPGFDPAYRMWNQRTDSDHRFTTDSSVALSMKASGYASEGWGLGTLGVAMCAPH